MSLLLVIVILFFSLVVVSRTSIRPFVIFANAGFLVLAGTLMDWIHPLPGTIGLVIMTVPSLLFTWPAVRRKLITSRLFATMKKKLPGISATEQIAIDAGTIGWESKVFSGDPRWEYLKELPPSTLSDEEQHFLNNEVEQLCALVDDFGVQKDQNLSPQAWEFMKQKRFWGMIIPKQYGGLQFSATAHSRIVSKLASRNSALGITVMVPNSLGPGELLVHYGTEEQKEHYLPRLAKGEEIPCFALTSTMAGSDAGAIRDTAVLEEREEGESKVLELRMNWEKRYITLAPVATLLGLAIKVLDPNKLLQKYYPDHPLAGQAELGISCALVPTSTPGITIGNRHNPLWTGFMNGPNSGEDVRVGVDALIGGVDYIGKGWRMLVECLATGRGISLPALSISGTQLCLLGSSAYTGSREQFRAAVGTFEGVAEELAAMAITTYGCKAIGALTTDAIDDQQRPAALAAIVKYFSTSQLRDSVIRAMDVHGGRAIVAGPLNYLESLYRSVPVGITVEGANILTRSMMIFGQGAIRCHPLLLEELKALNDDNNDPTTAKEAFDSLLAKHCDYHVRRFANAFLGGLGKGRGLINDAPATIARPWGHLAHLSNTFAWLADLSLLLLGGALKRKESVSACFADAWMHLVVASAIMRRWRLEGYDGRHRLLVLTACQHHIERAQQALYTACENMPVNRVWRATITWLAFPRGRAYKPPALENLVALGVQSQQSRETLAFGLVEDLHLSTDKGDPIHIVLQGYEAYQKIKAWKAAVEQKQPLNKTLPEWLSQLVRKKLITSAERKEWLEASAILHRAMSVDDFPALP